MKKYILQVLQYLAKAIIQKYKPFVIAITWTVGKTTTTHFTYEFLHAIYGDDVYVSPYHYNGEYGVPMTIFMTRSPGSNPIGWIEVFIKAFRLLFLSNTYPKYLVLEYGIDHIGEMDFMMDIAQPDIGILLNITRNHAMQFPDFEDYKKEKLKLALGAKKSILNMDDVVIAGAKNALTAPTLTYGVKTKNVDVTAKNIYADIETLNMTLVYDGKEYSLSYHVIGEFQAYNILPVFSLGIMLGVEIERIEQVLADIYPPSGRGVILKGIKDSIIIDGSYNGGFSSITGGVEYLAKLPDTYEKILFVGDMRELGNETKKMHTELAEIMVTSWMDKIVLVGEEMKKYALPVLSETLGEKLFHSVSSKIAGAKIREYVQNSEKQVVIFVKGSQNTIFLEEGIKEFLFDLRDQDKLCRQSVEWLAKKRQFFETVI